MPGTTNPPDTMLATIHPLAAIFFTAAGICLIIGITFWLVDPNRKD
jgi:hypothetical protein